MLWGQIKWGGIGAWRFLSDKSRTLATVAYRKLKQDGAQWLFRMKVGHLPGSRSPLLTEYILTGHTWTPLLGSAFGPEEGKN